ncbi:UDP-glucose 4-epimerase GalE [Cyanobacterium aponinum AL20118]|uniref:UDP-glucose 4-epimerase n=1 Tax=Cyanobacterium aponinum AL20115 TaxID=3090662 RepID=A0AAF0ZHF7_9CHRO|nr:UDP-glucose 4-epimerase GalE [Cyanobacterium aponinum]PHV62149.1 UDP-glucose 4-epimerase GalE [Cyanobacterium aponinum IPPAS B-1201]WPF90320.1 UDP-glucose 4-epimerase GalE [Cyanobacterium aponinum AL20115]
MAILITGGAGYIGSHTVKLLQNRGYDILVFDNLVYGHRDIVEKLGVSFIEGDLCDRTLLDDLFQEHNIEAVIHFAAYAYVGESVENPAKYYRNNVTYTLNLLEAMEKAGIRKIVFSSTCATYGIPEEVPIKETHPQNPINPYGYTKLVVEKMLSDFQRAYNWEYVAFRYFNAAGASSDGLIGEDHNPEPHLIPLILYAALGKRDSISILGDDYPTPDGTCIRDYIHVEDLAQAHLLGLEYLLDGGKSEVFNLGNGNGFSVKEVIKAAKKVTGKDFTVKNAPRRPGDPPILVGSSEKAKKILNWQPQYPDIETIISHAWQWHQSRHK